MVGLLSLINCSVRSLVMGSFPAAHNRFAAKIFALQQNVTRDPRSCKKQGPKRNEKSNH